MTSISTLSMMTPLRSSVNQAQTALTQAQTEVSSGTYADLGLTLGARTGSTLSLESEIDNLGTYTTSNAVATTRLSATSNALSTFLSTAQTMQGNVTAASGAGGTTTGLATSAQAALSSLVAGLNTTTAGQSIFGGINTTATPVVDTTSTTAAVQGAYQSFVASQGGDPSTIGAAAMQSFLTQTIAPMFSDASWQANASSASSQTISSSIAPSQTVATSVSANQGTFQSLAQAYTILAQFTGTTLSAAAQAAVVSTANGLIGAGTSSLISVQAGVGVAQTTVASASSAIATQVDTLKTSVGDLTDVDTYALSSQVTALQTQLEASYELTSRLQSLSLVNYLTSG